MDDVTPHKQELSAVAKLGFYILTQIYSRYYVLSWNNYVTHFFLSVLSLLLVILGHKFKHLTVICKGCSSAVLILN